MTDEFAQLRDQVARNVGSKCYWTSCETETIAAILAAYDRVVRERDRFLDQCIECNRDGDVWWIAGRPNEVYPMRDSAVAALLKEPADA